MYKMCLIISEALVGKELSPLLLKTSWNFEGRTCRQMHNTTSTKLATHLATRFCNFAAHLDPGFHRNHRW